jgi:hypothetical protein
LNIFRSLLPYQVNALAAICKSGNFSIAVSLKNLAAPGSAAHEEHIPDLNAQLRWGRRVAETHKMISVAPYPIDKVSGGVSSGVAIQFGAA